ncbi:hypothetical protein GCM10007901_37400 [Dyella acidisoli]|uniref:Uncharacterized protein n=2 Tax=Dyella acidisoli TaxID=1867834 RepID=A0ABQ5XT87_9GAMM|nr:hypothetical protein GCM10007901_37400 [Dyella acidisoli]
MTSEDNADRMLAKVAAFPFRIGHRYVCCVSILTLLVGLVACSYRAPDKTKLYAKTAVSESLAITAAKAQVGLKSENDSPLDTAAVSASPSTELAQVNASLGAYTTPRGRNSKQAVAAIDRVVGDVSVTLSSASAIDVAPLTGASEVDTSNAPLPSIVRPANERSGSDFPWFWLLAALALIAMIWTGSAHYRRRRVETLGKTCSEATDVAVQSVQTSPQPNSERSSEDATPVRFEAVTASETPHVETGRIDFSWLEWSYQALDYEGYEHWDAAAPIDFLPASLSAYIAQATPEADELPLESVGGEEVRFVEENENVSVRASRDNPLSELFDQLEAIAIPDGEDIPALLIERDSTLPNVMGMSSEPAQSFILEAWERLLRQTIPDTETLTLPWLLVSTLLLRADNANHREAESLYEEARKWIDLGMASDVERPATWLARHIDIDLRRAKRQKGASRLLSLRGMQSRYAEDLAGGEPTILLVWIDALIFLAECQFGDVALAKYSEAEAICVHLCELPASADVAQRRRADILRQRAAIEEGGARLKSLDTAQTLLDLLYKRVPSGDNALAVALTALARGNVLPPEQAKEAYSHALMHAFMAEGELHLRSESLQCRLAVQWAYENLPGMSVQSNVAIGLSTRLEALHVQHPETVLRMAQIYLRNADFARASELCEKAWRNGRATPTLLATWQEACRQWGSASTQPEQLIAQQQATRQLSIASAMR